MSKQYDNTNRGVLFKNDRKETDKHPDYTGKIDVNGTEFKLAAWIKEGKKGKFMSLAISTPQEMPPEQRQNSGADFVDSDVPF
jgi:uncharacterized protein (DUF736 family)